MPEPDVPYPALVQKLIEDLKAGRTKPRVIPEYRLYADEAGVEEVKEYFHRAKGLLGSAKHPKYKELLNQYVGFCLEYFKNPAHHGRTTPPCPPMEPSDRQDSFCIKEMPALSELTPHTGGRPRSLEISLREELIQKCKAQGMSDKGICMELDRKAMPTPAHWETKKGWTFLYVNDPETRQRIHRLFSKVALKAKHSP